MSAVSFRISIDNDEKVKQVFDKLETLIIREVGDNDENHCGGVHYHGICYDKGTSTIRALIKANFETKTLTGNKLYAMCLTTDSSKTAKPGAKKRTTPRAEAYICKASGKDFKHQGPNVILNTKKVNVQARHLEYWTENAEASENAKKSRKEVKSIFEGFGTYCKAEYDDAINQKIYGMCINLKLCIKWMQDYLQLIERPAPHNAKHIIVYYYGIYGTSNHTTRRLNFAESIGFNDSAYHMSS